MPHILLLMWYCFNQKFCLGNVHFACSLTMQMFCKPTLFPERSGQKRGRHIKISYWQFNLCAFAMTRIGGSFKTPKVNFYSTISDLASQRTADATDALAAYFNSLLDKISKKWNDLRRFSRIIFCNVYWWLYIYIIFFEDMILTLVNGRNQKLQNSATASTDISLSF